MDYCRYVNVFQGCGEIDLPKPEGIAAKWFFIKAGCGNTTPAATLPFGAMSVAPFSGGYPTGYGDHYPNSHSRPRHFSYGNLIRGFAHLQQSGTGAIEYYYNYAVVTPLENDDFTPCFAENEAAEPGYYTCILHNTVCELTATKHLALHRYRFAKSGCRIKVDFGNNGLIIPDNEPKTVDDLCITKTGSNIVTASARIDGIQIYFAVKGSENIEISDTTAVFTYDTEQAELLVSLSLRSCEQAIDYFEEGKDFDFVRKQAHDVWNQYLSALQIETEDETVKEIFYSNLYHSLIKPADRTGESFLYDGNGPFSVDLATLWDMYKTALPLIFMCYQKVGDDITETLLKIGESLHYLPNTTGISEKTVLHEGQARMLGAYALLTAYRYGMPVDVERMLKVIEDDVFDKAKVDFTEKGRCASHTWMLDMAEGCALTAQVAAENGNDALCQKLLPLAAQWKTVYDENTGLLKADSEFYEGTLYNYSFRPMVNMDERIALAGGKERFAALLDDFFGYGKEDTVQPTNYADYSPVAEGMKLGRFEGFNNESDTETPYSYIFANRHDRTCEILRSGMRSMFTTGRGGLPGNNDSGALSSYYVFAALGIFPVAGQDLFLIGSPFVDKAKLLLFNGNILNIEVTGNAPQNIYVKEVSWNGEVLPDYRITAKALFEGGTLSFTMTDTPCK